MILDNKLYEKWEKSVSGSGTINQYRPKVREYVNDNSGVELNQALSEERLFDFIFKYTDKSAKARYNAIKNFYLYIYTNILGNEKRDFPIILDDATKYDQSIKLKKKRKKDKTVFLDDNFDFYELFNDKYYKHLNNEIAAITIKAVIGCALSIGLGAGELLKRNNNKSYLTIDDINVTNNGIVEINVNNNTNINKIKLSEYTSNYVLSYLNIRNNEVQKGWGKKNKEGKEAFFIKLWNGRELEVDEEVYGNEKPAQVYDLVSYFLKYIAITLKVQELSINDLRSNIVYHKLLYTRGSALNEIVRLHGFSPFISEAHQRFMNKYNNKESLGFDFFDKTSLSYTDYSKDNEVDKVDEVIPETYMTEYERRKRNQKIVRELKSKYQNKCQVCEETIDLGNRVKYSEVHHIQPLGNEHKGIDNKTNMIVLCPNHHKMFDLGILTLNPMDCTTLIHINDKDKFNGKKIVCKHNLSNICIRYGYEHIYMKLVKELNIRD